MKKGIQKKIRSGAKVRILHKVHMSVAVAVVVVVVPAYQMSQCYHLINILIIYQLTDGSLLITLRMIFNTLKFLDKQKVEYVDKLKKKNKMAVRY